MASFPSSVKDMAMSISTGFSALTLATALALGVGCASSDRHVFNSTLSRPVTVSVIDTTNDQTVWTMPVPAGQKLVLDLDHSSTSDNPFTSAGVPANKLSWKTYPLASKAMIKGYQVGTVVDSGVTALPGTPVVLDVSYSRAQSQAPSKPVILEPQEGSADQAAEAAEPAPAAREPQAAEQDPAEAAEAADEPVKGMQAPEAPGAQAEPADAAEAPAEEPTVEQAPAEETEEAPQQEPIMFK